MSWYLNNTKAINQAAHDRAVERQNSLTKPPGSLGTLEQVAIRFSGQLGDQPELQNPFVFVFAADHGVADENVSAFPQVVTGEMVRNFANGGAAICALSKASGAQLEVIHLGTVNDPGTLNGVTREWIASASANLAKESAMTDKQLKLAMQAGYNAVSRTVDAGSNLVIGGDMGIANTTAATAIICAFEDQPPKAIAGPGTGLDAAGIIHKSKVVERALALHRPSWSAPIDILRSVGGFEIAALAGMYIAAAQQGVVSVVDGFIASSAALAAVKINPGVAEWLQLSHRSAEPGFSVVSDALSAAGAGAPLLDFQMRLGEGSGAALVLPLLQTACRVHNEMATFAEAGVSEE